MILVKRTTALLLAMLLVMTSFSAGIEMIAAQVSSAKVTVLQNDFIKITVDNATGRFGIRTVEGQPVRKNDQNVNMLFQGDDPETSFTTFRIDGTDYIFGNPYKFAANFFSETTPPRIVENPNGTKQIETVWKIKGVEIKQILMLYYDAADKVNAGNVNVRYEVLNRSGADVQLGTRILLDTMVAGNDGPQFQIGTAYRVPLMVERKLVHDPAAIGIPFEDIKFYKLPPYWVMRDKLNLDNPLATNVVAYGFNNIAEQNVNLVDEMIVGHWNGLANTKWDYTPNENLDFTRDTNDYGTADSAVAFYWLPRTLPNQQFQSFETVYGLGEIIEPDKVFSIRFLDTPQQLATLPDGSDYASEGVFEINAEIENLAMFDMEHSKIIAELTLASGLNFVELDELGNIRRDSNNEVMTEPYRSRSIELLKPAKPEEVEPPKYEPGDTVTVSFLVKANGRPWPTTKEYMLTAKSPETQVKVDEILGQESGGAEDIFTDQEIRAQYESTKANFIMLPPIGEAVPTYVYGVSPKELYSTDVKYLTVNLSNVEAYYTGNELTAPNFDLFLQEQVTGKRYKVPVQDSVIIQPTDDGFSGDMRITYRGGDEVNRAGEVINANLGPELPLGEYVVQIDYKGDTGGDEEIAAMYDITTRHSFKVSNNQATRVREAGILALYKQVEDLSSAAAGGTITGDLLNDLNTLFPGEPFEDSAFLYGELTAYKQAKTFIGIANKAIDPKFDLAAFLHDDAMKAIPMYQYKLFYSEEELEDFFTVKTGDDKEKREKLLVIRGMIKEVGTGADQAVIVDTKTEPAIINDAVAYSGKDLVFVRGKLDVFGMKTKVSGADRSPFFETLFVKGDGTLTVAGSGFVFHRGEWTLDFFNGFNKTLGDGYIVPRGEIPEAEDNEEDDSLNGSLRWAVGSLGDRLNPMRQVMIESVYFNKHSLFAPPSFVISGFGFSFNDFILRAGGISFGGSLSMKIIEAEVNNVVFDKAGFVGVEAKLKFNLDKDIGLLGSTGSGKDKENRAAKGEIEVIHYVKQVPGISNKYGIEFEADLKKMVTIQAELAFKQVADGRVLPDVIAFGTTLGQPGVLITGGTYLTAIRGAVRELADTIAGGTAKDPFPLVIQAGVDLRFGVSPAYFHGAVDLTVKRTGLKVEGKMDFSVKPDASGSDLIPMLTKALIEAQWVTPWFVRLQAEVDIGGWDVIIGKAGIFVGQNLEKNRIDFEGYVGAKVQIPSSVPVVGGLPLSSVFFGINNDKVWGSVGVLFISVGITYYWGGGVEFGTSGEDIPEGFIHMIVEDPELGPRLVVIGQGIETVATSWINTEQDNQGIIYREVAEGVKIIENGSTSIGVGGITVKNGGRVHEIPMTAVKGNAIIEMEYDSKTLPSFTLKDASGKAYPVVFDNTNTNPNANAFTQFIPAAESLDQVDSRKAFIIVPQDKVKSGGTWTLTALEAVETRLLNIPTAPELTETRLVKNESDPNKFTASWKVDHAKEGDLINLYLTEEGLSAGKTVLEDGSEVLEPGEPGLLIAKDVSVGANGSVSGSVTSGSTVIDVTKVQLLGDTEDIRGLLSQGNYYLRAELKSDAAYGTKTSTERFEIIDPLAPGEVSELAIEPAGNGLFALSFKPAAKKSSHGSYEHSYAIEALQEVNGKKVPYANFGEILYTEAELAPYWNAATGKYEGILLGGWNAVTTSDEVDTGSLSEIKLNEPVSYVGLEVGKEYVVGVSSVTLPPKSVDKNENYHFANRVDSAKKLLPVPVKPKLTAGAGSNIAASTHFLELLTKDTQQSIALTSAQKDLVVEAFYAEQSLGKVSFTNTASGSRGTLNFDQFNTDGPYAIELIATNTKTKDIGTTMLYLTVDTQAPILYIDEPDTGARTSEGRIRVKGTTSNDVAVIAGGNAARALTVNGQALTVAEDGTFDGWVTVSSSEPVVELVVQAKDAAGNENTAIVQVTNDSFAVPSAIVFDPLLVIEPTKSQQLKPYLKIATGKDSSGKPTFEEVEVPASERSRITYSVYTGDAVSLTAAGKVTGLTTGASLIEAKYKISDDVTVSGMVVAEVRRPEPVVMGVLAASTAAISGQTNATKVNVTLPADTTGQQLVYKIYPGGVAVNLPALNEDISDWSFLPVNRELTVDDAQDTIVVALRTSLGKQAQAITPKLTPKLWTAPVQGGGGGFPGGGGGGGGGGVPTPGPSEPQVETPSEPVELTINDQPYQALWSGNQAVIRVTAKDLNYSADQDIILSTKDQSARGYIFRFDAAVVKEAIEERRHISIDLPRAKLTVTPEMLDGMTQELEIQVGANNAAEVNAMRNVAQGLKANLLGAGAGVAIATNLPEASWSRYVPAKLAVPAAIDAAQITAVVLRAKDGSWTPLPWRLEQGEDGASVNVRLTGEGNLVFLQNSMSFTDVAFGSWARQTINDAAAKLFVMGKSADSFDPDGHVTRAEYPTILLRVAGLMNKSAESSFTDVGDASWYNHSVSVAAKYGIVEGKPDGSYSPNASLSRMEAMVMVGRMLGVLELGEKLSEQEITDILAGFEDGASIPEWARAAVALTIKQGIIIGTNGSVNPQGVLTRAQAAAIAVRLDDLITSY